MNKDSQFDFYEVVYIATQRPSLRDVQGCRGAILGKSQSDEGDWSYAVHIFDANECWNIVEVDLTSAGEKLTREDFYDGSSARVKIDQRSGEGSFTDD
jgi:hypothetical protein